MVQQRAASLVEELLLPRGLGMLLGLWLFISSFLWQHSQIQFNNSWIVGLASVLFAIMARRWEHLRLVNVVLAIWLFTWSLIVPVTSDATFRNNVVVSIAMFLVAVLPNVDLRV